MRVSNVHFFFKEVSNVVVKKKHQMSIRIKGENYPFKCVNVKAWVPTLQKRTSMNFIIVFFI